MKEKIVFVKNVVFFNLKVIYSCIVGIWTGNCNCITIYNTCCAVIVQTYKAVNNLKRPFLSWIEDNISLNLEVVMIQ